MMGFVVSTQSGVVWSTNPTIELLMEQLWKLVILWEMGRRLTNCTTVPKMPEYVE
jgi:hypothetical protein